MAVLKSPDEATIKSLTDPYVSELGLLVHTWAHLHDKLCNLFCTLTQTPIREVASAVWYVNVSDLSQRKMLVAAAEITLRKRQDVLEEIRWLINRVQEISEQRNKVVHSAVAIMTDEGGTSLISSWPSTDNPKAASLKDVENLPAYLFQARSKLEQLSIFARDLDFHLRFPESHSKPGRPKLQSVSKTLSRSGES